MPSPEALVVIEQMAAFSPAPDSPPRPVEETRQLAEEFGASMPTAEGVTFEHLDGGAFQADWARPLGATDGAALLYFHGGGYIAGSAKAHRPLVGNLAAAAGVAALSVDYRLAPEHPFPAAADDGLAAYRYLSELGIDRIAVGGDSAGGGLAVEVVARAAAEDLPAPRALILLSPWLDLTLGAASLSTNASTDTLVRRVDLEFMTDAYRGTNNASDADPLRNSPDVLPPTLVHVGDAESLLDDSRTLQKLVVAAGGDVTLKEWDDMFHIFQMFAAVFPEAREAVGELGAFLRKHVS